MFPWLVTLTFVLPQLKTMPLNITSVSSNDLSITPPPPISNTDFCITPVRNNDFYMTPISNFVLWYYDDDCCASTC